jgi:hypothetical protein
MIFRELTQQILGQAASQKPAADAFWKDLFTVWNWIYTDAGDTLPRSLK